MTRPALGRIKESWSACQKVLITMITVLETAAQPAAKMTPTHSASAGGDIDRYCRYCHWAQLRQGCIVVLSISQAMLVVTISPLPEQGDNTLPCQEGLVTISPPARAGLTQSTFCRDATVGADITNTIGLLASPEECPPGTTPLNTIHLRIKMLANVELIQSSCKHGVK